MGRCERVPNHGKLLGCQEVDGTRKEQQHPRPDKYWLKTSSMAHIRSVWLLRRKCLLALKKRYCQSACITLTYHLRLRSFVVVTGIDIGLQYCASQGVPRSLFEPSLVLDG